MVHEHSHHEQKGADRISCFSQLCLPPVREAYMHVVLYMLKVWMRWREQQRIMHLFSATTRRTTCTPLYGAKTPSLQQQDAQCRKRCSVQTCWSTCISPLLLWVCTHFTIARGRSIETLPTRGSPFPRKLEARHTHNNSCIAVRSLVLESDA